MTRVPVAVLQPTVVQYYSDDISNVGGLTSVLAAQVRCWPLSASPAVPLLVDVRPLGCWLAHIQQAEYQGPAI
jgi:hypothetical protein